MTTITEAEIQFFKRKVMETGTVRESNPGTLAPSARIMPLDQQASRQQKGLENAKS